MTQDSIYRARWNQPLPEDENTIHTFYPAEGQDLPTLLGEKSRHMLRRDLAGLHFIQLPYTLLADEVMI